MEGQEKKIELLQSCSLKCMVALTHWTHGYQTYWHGNTTFPATFAAVNHDCWRSRLRTSLAISGVDKEDVQSSQRSVAFVQPRCEDLNFILSVCCARETSCGFLVLRSPAAGPRDSKHLDKWWTVCQVTLSLLRQLDCSTKKRLYAIWTFDVKWGYWSRNRAGRNHDYGDFYRTSK
jgi:hypothetical protein